MHYKLKLHKSQHTLKFTKIHSTLSLHITFAVLLFDALLLSPLFADTRCCVKKCSEVVEDVGQSTDDGWSRLVFQSHALDPLGERSDQCVDNQKVLTTTPVAVELGAHVLEHILIVHDAVAIPTLPALLRPVDGRGELTLHGHP
jgi:hypothetical protein